MTEDEIRTHLENDGSVSYSVWIFSKDFVSCWEPGCCEYEYESIDDVIEAIKCLCKSLDKVEIVE